MIRACNEYCELLTPALPAISMRGCQMRPICGTLNLRHGQVIIDQQVELAGEEEREGRGGGDGRPSSTAAFVGRLPTLLILLFH